ncbi:MAG: glycosyltransferase family 2 protein [Chitinispirillales bacterium]|jgi:glycosyltransferase involved in cell wall biosynthesis|nr:glycosyltransferase family 2 protein [Chitinispirillales bacterium]
MQFKREKLDLVLITPARNEAAFIEGTIKSVITQTLKPKRWIIVSDGSTDDTDSIVAKYAEKHSWIELVRRPERKDRQFAAKVHSFNAGYEKLKHIQYDLIGNLDADVTFEPAYLEFLVNQFTSDNNLGVAGTPFMEDGVLVYDHGYIDQNHVSGACQIFRKECFEQIGGYTPIKGGGIDWTAVTSARMMGWRTWTFTEKVFHHHRKMGTGNGSFLMSRFRHGQKDYYLGGHPLWQLMRGVFQMTRKPYLLGGAFLMLGYAHGVVFRVKRPLSKELINFHRSEQMERVSALAAKIFGRVKNKMQK